MKSKDTNFSRRSFIGKTATIAAGITLAGTKVWGAPNYIPGLLTPNSKINGVQLGLITYSFREMKDQSAEAILQYVVECGISGIELMGGTAESFNGRPENKIDRRKYYSMLRKERKKSLTQEEEKEFKDLKSQMASYEKEVEEWNKTRSLDGFTKLRKMYNDAGVDIYAFKPDYLLNLAVFSSKQDFLIFFCKNLGRVFCLAVSLLLPFDLPYIVILLLLF